MIRTVILLALLLPARAAERRLALVTAYCPCTTVCCKGTSTPGVTKSGRRTKDFPHGISAAYSMLPEFTEVVVPGYKPTRHRPMGARWPVDDTGGDMIKSADKGILHLDVRFIHHDNARAWGVRWVVVTIYRRKK